ncbi:MAG: hypothetical protein P1V21_14415 [Rhizobiaceae bacterium]|nr:hypothetical protein [Rhizobiaceae bacterium]
MAAIEKENEPMLFDFVQLECTACGGTFSVPKRPGGRSAYCSAGCRSIGVANANRRYRKNVKRRLDQGQASDRAFADALMAAVMVKNERGGG